MPNCFVAMGFGEKTAFYLGKKKPLHHVGAGPGMGGLVPEIFELAGIIDEIIELAPARAVEHAQRNARRSRCGPAAAYLCRDSAPDDRIGSRPNL